MPDMMYRCCKCGDVYMKADDAVECEQSHQDEVELVSRKRKGLSHACHARYPHTVLVRMTDGRVVLYKFKEVIDFQ